MILLDITGEELGELKQLVREFIDRRTRSSQLAEELSAGGLMQPALLAEVRLHEQRARVLLDKLDSAKPVTLLAGALEPVGKPS